MSPRWIRMSGASRATASSSRCARSSPVPQSPTTPMVALSGKAPSGSTKSAMVRVFHVGDGGVFRQRVVLDELKHALRPERIVVAVSREDPLCRGHFGLRSRSPARSRDRAPPSRAAGPGRSAGRHRDRRQPRRRRCGASVKSRPGRASASPADAAGRASLATADCQLESRTLEKMGGNHEVVLREAAVSRGAQCSPAAPSRSTPGGEPARHGAVSGRMVRCYCRRA